MLVQTKTLKLKSLFGQFTLAMWAHILPKGSCSLLQNQEKIDFQMFVIYLNGQNLKVLLLQIQVIEIFFFFMEIGCYTFFLLYMWARYEPIWTNCTTQTVTLGANLLFKAQTIPRNAKSAFFFKVAFS